MSSGTRHVKIFTGAPGTASLNWQEEALLSEFTPVFKSVLSLHDPNEHVVPKSTAASSAAWPKWRSIPASIKHLASGLSQRKELANDAEDDGELPDTSLSPTNETSFLSTISLYSDPADTDGDTSLFDPSAIINGSQALSQFLEHSFAVHDDLQSSQLVGPLQSTYANDEDTTLNTTISTETSFLTTTSQNYSFNSTTSPTPKRRKSDNLTLNPIPNDLPISNLKDIPNAGYLTSITPQTLTLNLIVGIISIAAARSVKLRRGSRFMDVVEVLVADETKAGFSITFWLPPADSQERGTTTVKDELRNVLAHLRPQDVVMIRDVALSSFRGQVFGQSLSRRITRNATKLTLFYREALYEDDVSGLCGKDLWESENRAGPYAAKTRRVREWVLQFVGPGNTKSINKSRVKVSAKQGRSALAAEELPSDTQ